MIGFFLRLLFATRSIKQSEENNWFKLRYGEFFEEFKDGFVNNFYYFLFIFRRILILICLAFIEDGIFQLSVSISFSFIVIHIQIPFYLLWRKAFIKNGPNYYNIINEFIISIYHITVFTSFTPNHHQNNQYAVICYNLILSAVVLNIAFSLFNAVKDLITKIKNCINRKRSGKVYKIGGDADVFNNSSMTSEIADQNDKKRKL